MKRIELTDEVKSGAWWQLWSNQAALLSVVTLLQGLLPFWKGVVSAEWFQLAGAVLASAAFVLRNVKQPGLKREKPNA